MGGSVSFRTNKKKHRSSLLDWSLKRGSERGRREKRARSQWAAQIPSGPSPNAFLVRRVETHVIISTLLFIVLLLFFYLHARKPPPPEARQVQSGSERPIRPSPLFSSFPSLLTTPTSNLFHPDPSLSTAMGFGQTISRELPAALLLTPATPCLDRIL